LYERGKETIIEKLKNNYSPIKEITILSSNVATNTFNTFWDNVERNGDYKCKFNSNKINKNRQNLNENDEFSNNYIESNDNTLNSSFEDNEDSPKVLEVLKVLEDKNQKDDEKGW
jgi:hypothetical protein